MDESVNKTTDDTPRQIMERSWYFILKWAFGATIVALVAIIAYCNACNDTSIAKAEAAGYKLKLDAFQEAKDARYSGTEAVLAGTTFCIDSKAVPETVKQFFEDYGAREVAASPEAEPATLRLSVLKKDSVSKLLLSPMIGRSAGKIVPILLPAKGNGGEWRFRNELHQFALKFGSFRLDDLAFQAKHNEAPYVLDERSTLSLNDYLVY